MPHIMVPDIFALKIVKIEMCTAVFRWSLVYLRFPLKPNFTIIVVVMVMVLLFYIGRRTY